MYYQDGMKKRKIPNIQQASIPTKELVRELKRVHESLEAYVDRLKSGLIIRFLSADSIRDETAKQLGSQVKQDVQKWMRFFKRHYPDDYFDRSPIYRAEWKKFWANLNRINASSSEIWGRLIGTRDSILFLRTFIGRWKAQMDTMMPLFPKVQAIPLEDKDDVQDYIIDLKEQREAVASYGTLKSMRLYKAGQLRGIEEAYRMSSKSVLSTERRMRQFAGQILVETDLSEKGQYLELKSSEKIYTFKQEDGKMAPEEKIDVSFKMLFDNKGNFVLSGSPYLGDDRIFFGHHKPAYSYLKSLEKSALAFSKSSKKVDRYNLAKTIRYILKHAQQMNPNKVFNIIESEAAAILSKKKSLSYRSHSVRAEQSLKKKHLNTLRY